MVDVQKVIIGFVGIFSTRDYNCLRDEIQKAGPYSSILLVFTHYFNG